MLRNTLVIATWQKFDIFYDEKTLFWNLMCFESLLILLILSYKNQCGWIALLLLPYFSIHDCYPHSASASSTDTAQQLSEQPSPGWLTADIYWRKIFFMSPSWRDISAVCIYWLIDLTSQPAPQAEENLPLADRQELINQRCRWYGL